MGTNYVFVIVFKYQVIDVILYNLISISAAFDCAMRIMAKYDDDNVDFDRVEIWDCSINEFVVGLTNC